MAKVERHDIYSQEQLDNPDDWSAPTPGIQITMNMLEARQVLHGLSRFVDVINDPADFVRLFLDLREAVNE